MLEVVVGILIVVLLCVTFFVTFWIIRVSRKGAARLPRLEKFFSLPTRTVRWGAFLVGTTIFSALFSCTFTAMIGTSCATRMLLLYLRLGKSFS